MKQLLTALFFSLFISFHPVFAQTVTWDSTAIAQKIAQLDTVEYILTLLDTSKQQLPIKTIQLKRQFECVLQDDPEILRTSRLKFASDTSVLLHGQEIGFSEIASLKIKTVSQKIKYINRKEGTNKWQRGRLRAIDADSVLIDGTAIALTDLLLPETTHVESRLYSPTLSLAQNPISLPDQSIIAQQQIVDTFEPMLVFTHKKKGKRKNITDFPKKINYALKNGRFWQTGLLETVSDTSLIIDGKSFNFSEFAVLRMSTSKNSIVAGILLLAVSYSAFSTGMLVFLVTDIAIRGGGQLLLTGTIGSSLATLPGFVNGGLRISKRTFYMDKWEMTTKMTRKRTKRKGRH